MLLADLNLDKAGKYLRAIFIAGAILASFAAMPNNFGNGLVFLFFSLVANALLYFGFREKAIFFDTFIGLFLWVGFWLKLTIKILFFDGKFSEPVGAFDYSQDSFNYALMVSACGMSGLLLASFIREKYIFNHLPSKRKRGEKILFEFYEKNRKLILLGFVLIFVYVSVVNSALGIYQKGSITQTFLPFGLNGVFKWLILFGLAAFSAIILKFELIARKQLSILVILLVLLESFSTNTSLLSRGMVLNCGALIYGVYVYCSISGIKIKLKTVVMSLLIFCSLFALSVVMVNDLRGNGLGYLHIGKGTPSPMSDVKKVDKIMEEIAPLFLDRWVGIEGVMAVSSSSKIGWSLWAEAWNERYSETTMGFYDANLIDSPYKNTDFTKYHHLSLPGILAFFYYPGSFSFLFISMLMLGIFAALIEFSVFKFGGGNLILCALISEVVAYRFANFGYVPAQSYLLFGTIFLNILIIYFIYFIAEYIGSKSLIKA